MINVKKVFVPKNKKVYSLLRGKKGKVHEFIKEKLKKEYIRPSKSPQIALVFFVEKKDSKKRIVQSYRYLNKWTVKNNYPLFLI